MIDVIIGILQLAVIAYCALLALLLLIAFAIVGPYLAVRGLIGLIRGEKYKSLDEIIDEAKSWEPEDTFLFEHEYFKLEPATTVLDVTTIHRNHYAGEIHSRLDRDAQIYPFVLRGKS